MIIMVTMMSVLATVVGLAFLTLLFMFVSVNVIIRGYSAGQRWYWRRQYETSYERKQRELKSSRGGLPKNLGLVSLDQELQDHPDEARAIEIARLKCEGSDG